MTGLREYATQVSFGLAGICADHIRTIQIVEACIDLVRNGAGEVGLPGARRPIENDAPRRRDAEMSIDVRIAQRQLDELPHDAGPGAASPPDILEGDVEDAFGHVGVELIN